MRLQGSITGITRKELKDSEMWQLVHHHFHILPYSGNSCLFRRRTESFRACPVVSNKIHPRGLGEAVALLLARLASDQSKLFESFSRVGLSRTLDGSRLRRPTTSPSDLAVSVADLPPSSDASMKGQSRLCSIT